LEDSWVEIAIDQREFLGFSLCSPFDLVAPQDIPNSEVRAKHFKRMLNESIFIEGYLVTVKPTRTIGGKEMNFGTWIDRDGYFFDSIHFPQIVSRYPFKGRGVYRIWGQITVDFGVYNIEVSKMEKLGVFIDPRV
jgi:DNA polymerase-3 subunit alpha